MKHNKDDQDQQNDQPDIEVSGVDDARRKFSKAAGVVAPVLLSLSSKPVWARDCGPSGIQSGNLSNPCTPIAFTPTSLKTYPNWTGKDTPFDTVFGKVPGDLSLFGTTRTLIEVINLTSLPAETTQTQLMVAFGDCTNAGEGLRAAVLNYAKQHIASYATRAAFSNYVYPVNPDQITLFQSMFTGGDACSDRSTELNNETARLAGLKPSL